jgi:hypothetical protein
MTGSVKRRIALLKEASGISRMRVLTGKHWVRPNFMPLKRKQKQFLTIRLVHSGRGTSFLLFVSVHTPEWTPRIAQEQPKTRPRAHFTIC